MAVSSSSPSSVRSRDKLGENIKLLRSWMGRHRAGGDLAGILQSLDSYDERLYALSGKRLHEAAVLEIGFGARPLRLMALHGMGVDAAGVDLEAPVLGQSLRALIRTWRANGTERAMKSALRSALFDPKEQRVFSELLATRAITPRLDRRRLHLGDAADLDLDSGSLDLIISEDVFEHIPRTSLARLVPKMADWLTSDGIALVRPLVFTGICGNHLMDWYPHRVVQHTVPADAEPWEHLRGGRSEPNTHLNRMSRRAFRDLFLSHFEIVEEHVRWPDLGRRFLTGVVASELQAWSADELFSNSVQFVLRHR